MASIFLSYSHEDRKRAERIAKSLESVGHQVWWDQHIRAGSRFSKDINEALKKSDLVVVHRSNPFGCRTRRRMVGTKAGWCRY
jgi:hypothetical protein